MMRKVLFLTGTRADFGKLKPLIQTVRLAKDFEYVVAATGMHLDPRYGQTEIEILKSGFVNLESFSNTGDDDAMDLTLARTINGFSAVLKRHSPDLVVVHGDRVEALAGAITGALNNTLVAHVEGGEFSGTVDELIRHSITKLAHIHYVANDAARDVVLQLGESPDSIWLIGSPEVDIMLSPNLPSLAEVKSYYNIPFNAFSVLAYHPVTTEIDEVRQQVKELSAAISESGLNFVAVYPNNDHGSAIILEELRQLEFSSNVRLIPSIRFESFQTLLKSATFIIGNSSSGVREAGVHGTPAINVGTRQSGRSQHPLILNVEADRSLILAAMKTAVCLPRAQSMSFGDGRAAERFLKSLTSERLWQTPLQKEFQRT